jgi:hypothetical protein
MARRVGHDLMKRHGNKRNYTVQEIRDAARRQKFPETWDCWALSLFSSPPDFVDYHLKTGELCDYTYMRTTMLEAVSADRSLPEAIHSITPATEVSWFSDLMDYPGSIEISLPDINYPDVDL